VIALQLAVGLRMVWCRQDMPYPYQVEIIAEGSGDLTSTVIREESGTVFDRYLGHAGSVHRFLNHLDQGVG